MSDSQQILDSLTQWNEKLLRRTDIPFDQAAASLLTDSPLICATRISPNVNSKWTINRIDTNTIATLTYTGLWSWGSNMITGNFVPSGELAPPGVSDDRLQTAPSFKCDISFGFDTTVHDNLWRNMRAIDDYMGSLQDFNKGNKPRRSWQDGTNPTQMDKYVISGKLFLKRAYSDPPIEKGFDHLPYEVHPWIDQACHDHKSYVPNPDKVRFYELVGRTPISIENSNTSFFRKNDIIRMTFVIHINAGVESWHSEIIPIELIRVGNLSLGSSLPKQPDFPKVGTTFEYLQPGAEVAFFEAPVRDNKRKARDFDDEQDTVAHNRKRQATSQIMDIDAMDEDYPEPPPAKQKLRITIKGKEKESKYPKA